MITLPKSEYEKILEHARKNLPEEACGLIAGEVTAEGKAIREVYLLTNIDHSNEHFSLDPKEQLAAIKEIYSVNESVQLKCALTDIFMDEEDMVVIKSIDIPEMRGVEHTQTYSLDLETDRSFELIME